jgi:hypothetical protein
VGCLHWGLGALLGKAHCSQAFNSQAERQNAMAMLGPCRTSSRMRSIGEPPIAECKRKQAEPENLSNVGPHTVPQPRHWSCVAFQLFNGSR